MTTVTVTERGSFRRCRRMWDLSSQSRMNLEPIAIRKPLVLGSLVHQTLQSWLEDPIVRSLSEMFDIHAAQALKEANDSYIAKVGTSMSPTELEPYMELMQLGHAMMDNYQTHYKTPLFDDFDIIAPEQQVLIPVPDSYDRTTGEQNYLEATFDGLIQHRHTGDIYVLEHKTYEQRPKQETLQMNDQFLGYVWAAKQLGVGNVVGIAYDGMWKRATPPRGRTFEELFLRTLIIRPLPELNEFHINLAHELDDMTDPNLSIYPNRNWMGCFDCGFEKLCTAMSRGEDAQYIQERFYQQRKDKADDTMLVEA